MTLNRNMRLLIVGGPSTGKTTLSSKLSREYEIDVKNTDNIMNRMDWSTLSQFISDAWFTLPYPWIIEGVVIPRALRKWFLIHKEPPCDIIIKLDKPRIRLTAGQLNMMKGHETVWKEVLPNLKGIEIIYQ